MKRCRLMVSLESGRVVVLPFKNELLTVEIPVVLPICDCQTCLKQIYSLMSKLLRYYAKGNMYFVTSVTHNREPFLDNNYSILVDIFKELSLKLDFKLIAYVVMPDHFHLLIDPKEKDLSDIMKRIKIKFAYQFRSKNNLYRKTVWQKRFWDHIIRDQEDLNRHIDYIHYNPIKHLKKNSPFDWKFSSIHNYKEYYSDDWGVNEVLLFDGEFGE